MTWLRLDDSFFDHPKVREAGRDATLFHLVALEYCARNLTDGFVPVSQLTILAVKAWQRQSSIGRLINALTRQPSSGGSSLWTEIEGGYSIHDFNDYNPTRSEKLAERMAARLRMERVRAAKREGNAQGGSGERHTNDA